MPLPFLKKHYKTAAVLSDRIYLDRFDSEHCTRIAPQIERLISKSYQSIVLLEESKKKIIDLGTPSILNASLHKSHFDYIAICLKLFLEGLPYPRTIAGSNLLTWITRSLIKHSTKIDMIRWGAISIQRTSSVSRDLPDICNRIEILLKSDKSVLTFPEMEIINRGEKINIKTGRAYTGKVRKFASALFSPAINASKEREKLYIVPMSVSYDFVAEDSSFGSLAKADKMKKSKNPLACFAGKLYYTFLESRFFWNLYTLGKGNIYIDIGEPIRVEANASKKELAQRAQEEAARCYRITIPALVSYAISKGSTSRDELQKSVERYSTMLKEANINFQPSSSLEESVNVALQGLSQRKIISNHKEISVRAPEIINYYANTIAHHFESKLDSGNEEYLPDVESVI
jgi:glycerol-3-phosphate O-acyltransferase